MDKKHFPKNKIDIFRIFALYNIPEEYYHLHIESISYSNNEVYGQELVNIKYYKNAKTLQGQTGSSVYIINRGNELPYNSADKKPESEFLYYINTEQCQDL
jgi:hypothetical protein